MAEKSFRILITGDKQDLASRLPKQSAHTSLEWIPVPVLQFEAIPVSKMALSRLSEVPVDWIIFTSPRAVRFWSQALLNEGYEMHTDTKVACIGERTALAADTDGFTPDFFPLLPGTEEFLAEFELTLKAQRRPATIIVPSAEKGRGDLQKSLLALGCQVLTLPVYRTKPIKNIQVPLTSEELADLDLLFFTSPSSVKAFTAQVPLPAGVPIGCLGTYTATHLKKMGVSSPRILPSADYERIGELLC